jgi:hypothetical protein
MASLIAPRMASLIRHARLAEVESARRALEDGWLAEVGALQKKVAASDAARARSQAEALGARQQLDAYEARVKQLEEEAMAAGLSVSPFTPPPLLPVSSGAVPGAIGTESAGGHRFDQSLGIASVIASSPFIHGGTGGGTGGGKGSGTAEEDELGFATSRVFLALVDSLDSPDGGWDRSFPSRVRQEVVSNWPRALNVGVFASRLSGVAGTLTALRTRSSKSTRLAAAAPTINQSQPKWVQEQMGRSS